MESTRKISEVKYLEWFGHNLMSLMMEYGITQNELAIDSGICQGTISKYCNGLLMPSARTIVNLAYALDCEMDELADPGAMIE